MEEILFFGLKPPFSMSLKNSSKPSIDITRKSPATEYLFQTMAPINTETNTAPVVALMSNSFNLV